MTTIAQYFEQAQLSLAAYALDLLPGMSGTSANSDTYIASLKTGGMSQAQADTFATTYTVVAQSGGLGSLTGFSATLFQNTQTGQKYLAIRGTELGIGLDLWADATIAFGNPFLNLQIPALKSFYDQLRTDGLITSADTLTVSGHSLGGYLAQLLTMYDPVQVSQTYTYNAPGFTGASALAVSLLQLYMGAASGSNISAKLTNVQGMGPNIIDGLGNVIGGEQAIFTEGTTHSGTGNDELIGGAGTDFITGGTGNDKLFGDSDQTTIANQGDDYMDDLRQKLWWRKAANDEGERKVA